MPDQPKTDSLFIRMHRALSRTAHALGRTVDAVAGRRLAAAFFDELEETLILADCGAPAAMAVVAELRQKSNAEREYRPEEVRGMLADIIAQRLTLQPMPVYDELFVMLFVGVNGAGKTTTVGKMAYRLAGEGKKVIIAAGDTFRAAAADQLSVWAGRANAQLVTHQPGSDPAAVVFDAISAA
ncbi:MAG: signal recognition particle receptor subunit alpha, partial [Clostridia bacterium]|nr:signal recognition particle receptor subunit alpha [Clostridia bacterium]